MFTNPNAQITVQIISTKGVIRSKNLISKLTEMGLNFKISPGVVPNEIDFQSGAIHSALLSKLICQRNMRLGEVGCAIAHKNAISNFLDSDKKFGIIFEDDAEIIADFNLDTISKVLDSSVPIVIVLGWIPGFAVAKRQHVLLSEEPIELITSPTCTFAYAINRPAAKLIIGGREKIIDLADWPIYTLNKVTFFAIDSHSPWVTANHDPKFSTIGERATSISTSPLRIAASRIRLGSSLIALMLFSKSNYLNVSLKQIVHRLFIRDMLYKYGKSQVSKKTSSNNVIPLPVKFKKILEILKFD